MCRSYLFMAVVVFSCILGLEPSKAKAETIVFYCEVKPESNETWVALAEGSLNLKSKVSNASTAMEAATLRVVDSSGRIQPATKIPRHIMAQISIWREVLEGRRSLASVVADLFGASFWSGSNIDLGDVARGKTIQKQVTLPAETITDDLFANFDLEQEFDAPSGVFLDSYMTMNTQPERTISVAASATVRPDADVEDGEILSGYLILNTPDAAFNEMVYSMGVSLRVVGPQDKGGGFLSGLNRRLLLYIAGIMLAIVGGALYFFDFHLFEPKGRMQGKLKIVRDPTRGESGISVIDLQLAAHRFKKKSITLGNGPDADIQLPDESVKPAHCRIFPVHDRGENKIFVTPLDGNAIRINQRKFNMGNAVLDEGTQIRIGRFKFEFEQTDVYRQVEVWKADGEIQRGVLVQLWDLDSSGFSMVPFKEKYSTEELLGLFYFFERINMVKFYRSGTRIRLKNIITLPSRLPRRAIVTFKNGSSIECRMNKYAPGKGKHLFALPSMADKKIDYYLMIEQNVKDIKFL